MFLRNALNKILNFAFPQTEKTSRQDEPTQPKADTSDLVEKENTPAEKKPVINTAPEKPASTWKSVHVKKDDTDNASAIKGIRLPKLRDEPKDLGFPELQVFREEHSIIVDADGKKFALVNDFTNEEWMEFIDLYSEYEKKDINKLVFSESEWEDFKKKNPAKELVDKAQHHSNVYKIILTEVEWDSFKSKYPEYAENVRKKLVIGEGQQGIFRVAREIIGEEQTEDGEIHYRYGPLIGVKKTKKQLDVAEEEYNFYKSIDHDETLKKYLVHIYAAAKTKNKKGSVTIYEFTDIAGIGDGEKYIAYISKKFAEDKANKLLHITQSLLEAVSAIHKKNIFHRDIKPQNILFEKDGTLKLTDFGSALYGKKSVSDHTTFTHFPPEAILNGTTSPSDLDGWQVGLTLLQFYGVNLDDYFEKVENEGRAIYKEGTKLSDKKAQDAFQVSKRFRDFNASLKEEIEKLISDKNIPEFARPIISMLLQFDPKERKNVTATNAFLQHHDEFYLTPEIAFMLDVSTEEQQNSWAHGLDMLQYYGVDLDDYFSTIKNIHLLIQEKERELEERKSKADKKEWPRIAEEWSQELSAEFEPKYEELNQKIDHLITLVPAEIQPIISGLLNMDPNQRISVNKAKELLIEVDASSQKEKIDHQLENHDEKKLTEKLTEVSTQEETEVTKIEDESEKKLTSEMPKTQQEAVKSVAEAKKNEPPKELDTRKSEREKIPEAKPWIHPKLHHQNSIRKLPNFIGAAQLKDKVMPQKVHKWTVPKLPHHEKAKKSQKDFIVTKPKPVEKPVVPEVKPKVIPVPDESKKGKMEAKIEPPKVDRKKEVEKPVIKPSVIKPTSAPKPEPLEKTLKEILDMIQNTLTSFKVVLDQISEFLTDISHLLNQHQSHLDEWGMFHHASQDKKMDAKKKFAHVEKEEEGSDSDTKKPIIN